MPKKIVIDMSDIEERCRTHVDPDWKERIQYDDGGNLMYASGGNDIRYRMELFKDAGDNLMGACTCPWIGRQKEGSVAKPCKHLLAAWMVEMPEGKAVAEKVFGDGTKTPDTRTEVSVEPAAQVKHEKTPAQKEAEKGQLIVPKWKPKHTITIWPSSVGMLETCPASRVIGDEDTLIDSVGVPAKVGRAAHELCEDLVRNGWGWPPDDLLEKIAAKHGVPQEITDLRFIGIFAAQAWNGNQNFEGVKKWFFRPNIEVTREFKFKHRHPYMQGVEATIKIRGRNDLDEAFPEEERGVVLDWKSGRRQEEDDYSGQMKAEAVLLASKDKRIKSVTMITVWLRDRTMDVITFTRDELKKWLNDLVKYNAFWDGQTYGPGKHCRYCSKMAICPGREAVLNGTAKFLMTTEDDELIVPIVDEEGNLIPDRAWPMYQHVKMVQAAAGQFMDEFKTRIREGGAMPIPALPGREIRAQETKGDLVIDPIEAWPILRAHLQTDERIAACVSISKGKLEDLIAEQNEKGEKGKAIAAVMEDLEKAGALGRAAPRVQVRVLRTPEPEKE